MVALLAFRLQCQCCADFSIAPIHLPGPDAIWVERWVVEPRIKIRHNIKN